MHLCEVQTSPNTLVQCLSWERRSLIKRPNKRSCSFNCQLVNTPHLKWPVLPCSSFASSMTQDPAILPFNSSFAGQSGWQQASFYAHLPDFLLSLPAQHPCTCHNAARKAPRSQEMEDHRFAMVLEKENNKLHIFYRRPELLCFRPLYKSNFLTCLTSIQDRPGGIHGRQWFWAPGRLFASGEHLLGNVWKQPVEYVPLGVRNRRGCCKSNQSQSRPHHAQFPASHIGGR